jgi:hypothetical protein
MRKSRQARRASRTWRATYALVKPAELRDLNDAEMAEVLRLFRRMNREERGRGRKANEAFAARRAVAAFELHCDTCDHTQWKLFTEYSYRQSLHATLGWCPCGAFNAVRVRRRVLISRPKSGNRAAGEIVQMDWFNERMRRAPGASQAAWVRAGAE